MKKYILIFRSSKLTSEVSKERFAVWGTWIADLLKSWSYISAEAFADDIYMATEPKKLDEVKRSDANIVGYLILRTHDMNELKKHLETCPIFDFGGTVEIRELKDLNEAS